MGLEDVLLFRGEIAHAPAFFGALDVFVSSSYTEALPGVVGEAMACGVPCAATDVGDTAYLVGETGCMAGPRDPEALAQAILALAGLRETDRATRGALARARIREHFSLGSMADRYLALYAGPA
jgi:glycosyltransferase involved in cell wall biosynthesis